MTSRELTKLINRTKTGIDIKINRLGLTRRKYFYNFDYFKKIDTPEKAYWLGFIYADGSVSDTELTIKLQIKDADHLKKFNKALGGNMEVKKFNRQCNLNDEWYGGCEIRCYSTEMVNDLKKFGVYRNKSLIIEYPKISSELNSHFIRGFFDGDGCVTKSTHKNKKKSIKYTYVRADFTCGSLVFLETLRSVLHDANIHSYINQERNNTYRLRVGGMHNTNDFFNYIYNDSTVLLDRKYNKKLHLYKEFNIEQRLLLHAEKCAKNV